MYINIYLHIDVSKVTNCHCQLSESSEKVTILFPSPNLNIPIGTLLRAAKVLKIFFEMTDKY